MRIHKFNYIAVGLFVLAMLGAAVGSAFLMTGGTQATDSYSIVMDNVADMKFGTQVRYEGYTIGQVEIIEPITDGAINHAVILRKAQIHHLADNNLTRTDNRPLGDLVHSQDRNLRKVDDGGRHDPSHGSQAGNREGSALKVL